MPELRVHDSRCGALCPNCSQRTDTARLSFADMTRDLIHAFVNVERGPLVFAWALLTRPGAMAREYVEGRRRRYYGPFATLAVLVGLATLAVNLSGFQALSQEVSAGPATVLQHTSTWCCWCSCRCWGSCARCCSAMRI